MPRGPFAREREELRDLVMWIYSLSNSKLETLTEQHGYELKSDGGCPAWPTVRRDSIRETGDTSGLLSIPSSATMVTDSTAASVELIHIRGSMAFLRLERRVGGHKRVNALHFAVSQSMMPASRTDIKVNCFNMAICLL